MIKYDKKLANNYFKGVDTCYILWVILKEIMDIQTIL
jgi:hypothetical protein